VSVAGLRKKARRAYTVVEVMMALSVLSIGATGVIALQKAALIGNTNARDLATATAIASAWIERLRYDGLRWVQRDNGTSTIAETTYLQVVADDFPNVIAPPEARWHVPAASGDSWFAGVQPTADVRGMDTSVASETAFCTNIRLTQVLPGAIRAEVRVFWLRNHNTNVSQNISGTFGGSALCDPGSGYIDQVSSDAANGRYHFVYMTSAILRQEP
jgi:prepilin-type N-terminal cleavage/methylation domain-containing protein